MLKFVEYSLCGPAIWILLSIFILVKSDDSAADLTCTSGWTLNPPSGTCIKFVEDIKPWSDARDACRAQGSDLVKVVDDSMNQLIADHISAQPPLTSYWIGLNDIKIEGNFKWLDEDSVTTYEKWATGQPNDIDAQGQGAGQDCVEMGIASPNEWNDIECTTPVRYVCEKPAHSSSITCPSGWTVSASSRTCIKFVEQKYSWSDSREACRTEGGDLVKIVDSAMNGLIAEYIIDQPELNSYWIGLHDNNQDRKFVWLDETTETSLNLWSEGQPNNAHNNQDCVEMGLMSKSEWNDIECSFAAYPICEIPAGDKDMKWTPKPLTVTTTTTTARLPIENGNEIASSNPESKALIGADGKETASLVTTSPVPGEKSGRSATVPFVVGLIVYIPVVLIVAYVFLTKYYKSLRKKKDNVLSDAVDAVNDIIESDVMEMEKARATAKQGKGGEGSLRFI